MVEYTVLFLPRKFSTSHLHMTGSHLGMCIYIHSFAQHLTIVDNLYYIVILSKRGETKGKRLVFALRI